MRTVICIIALVSLVSVGLAGNALNGTGTPTAVPTFECVGITVPFNGDDNLNSTCEMRYRPTGGNEWKPGHPLFTCRKKRQYRGSLVHLTSNTRYEIELTCKDPDGGTSRQSLTCRTWNESFPIGKTTLISGSSKTIRITESGTPNAYHLVQSADSAPAVINLQHSKANGTNGIEVAANYVIIRNLKIMKVPNHGIYIAASRHDVVIEDCEITGWGPGTAPGTFDYGQATGILAMGAAKRIIIQRNRIHHPQSGANSWEDPPRPGTHSHHPAGPQPISFIQSFGNHVIRYNHLYSDSAHMYNDVIGGGINGGSGNMKCDTDIYGNIISHAWDDGLEIEGNNVNIRIWGNVIHNTNKAFGFCVVGSGSGTPWFLMDPPSMDSLHGPMYVWRNLIYDLDHGSRPGNVAKHKGRGACYYYNNTILNQAGARSMWDAYYAANVTALNNIIACSGPFPYGDKDKASHCLNNNWARTETYGNTNWLDYNLYVRERNNRRLNPEWEQHGIFGTTPKYDKKGKYDYFLQKGTKGWDGGVVIPNFADSFSDNAPDMGACERDIFAMKVGPGGGVKPGTRDRGPGASLSLSSKPCSDFRVFNIHGQLVQAFAQNGYRLPLLGNGIYFAGSLNGSQSRQKKVLRIR